MDTTSDLNSARSKLDGLLKELSEKSDESLEGNAIAIIDSLTSSMPPPSTPTKRSASAKGPRKRRKKDSGVDTDSSDGIKSHSSYIMKLFDRSVDFAPFVEDTPLYTLAREWMENKPHRMRLASEMHDYHEMAALSSSQGSSSSLITDTVGDESKEVYSLPLPKLKKEKKEQLRIPKPLPQPPTSLNIHYNANTAPNINDLKQSHIRRWKNVKTSWKQVSLTNQAHYAPSIKAIRELFEPYK